MTGTGAYLPAHPEGSGASSWIQHRWHQENVRRYPGIDRFNDLHGLFRELAEGHAPPRPLLEQGDKVVTVGSCFAARLRHVLNEVGFSADMVLVPSGLNNTFAILDFVSWSINGEQTETGYRYDRDAGGAIVEWQPEEERSSYRSLLAEAGAFVFTLGLAEVWQDSETGGVFWRGVPEHIFDERRHVFRTSTVVENLANIESIVGLIRAANASAPIVFTLSPVPAKATFRAVSCMTTDCVSKSILRVALDELESMGHPGVFYWPSFEMVRWVGGHLDWRAYGADDGNGRHVSNRLVEAILETFVASFFSRDAHERYVSMRPPERSPRSAPEPR